MLEERTFGALVCFGLLASACGAESVQSIEVYSARVLGSAELDKEFPSSFIDSEDIRGRVAPVEITISGAGLGLYAGGRRNPVIKYVDCKTRAERGYSFQPFIAKQGLMQYASHNEFREHARYHIASVINLDTARLGNVCVLLESRSSSGLVAKSRLVPLQ